MLSPASAIYNRELFLGIEILHDPFYNKGTGFPKRERDRLDLYYLYSKLIFRLGIRGLVPPVECTIEVLVYFESEHLFSQEQLERIMYSYHKSGLF